MGQDLYGDTLFYARRGIATDPNRPGVIATPYGLLDPNPTANEKILPRNYGHGPGTFLLNARIAKVFSFGSLPEASTPSGSRPSTTAAGHRFNLSVGLSVRNLLNHTNPGSIIGNINSPLFGQANQTESSASSIPGNFLQNATNRRVELQARVTF